MDQPQQQQTRINRGVTQGLDALSLDSMDKHENKRRDEEQHYEAGRFEEGKLAIVRADIDKWELRVGGERVREDGDEHVRNMVGLEL